MLKNQYQEIIIGYSTISLIRGIISCKRSRSTLLIDDPKFYAENYSSHYLSELEVLAINRLGRNYEIPELEEIRDFLLPSTVSFATKSYRLMLGGHPLNNLRELLRKFPMLIDESDMDLFYNETEESFGSLFFEELKRFESLNHEMSNRPKGVRFEIQGPKWFKTIYSRFGAYLNKEYSESKDLKYSSLLHLLAINSEDKLKTYLSVADIPFYFFRILSPVYRLQDFFLNTQLKRRLILLGGDYKLSSVQFWQFFENKFENLLLESFEGVITGERVLFFSHLPEDVPFKIKSPYSFYRKAKVGPSKRRLSPFPPTSLTFIGDEDSLGSSTPYRVFSGSSENSSYEWPYPELPGSKFEFYIRDINESFLKDSEGLPFEKVPAGFESTQGVTLDLRPIKDLRKSEEPVLSRLPIEIIENDSPVKGFEYWGPFRYRSLGLLALSYGVEQI